MEEEWRHVWGKQSYVRRFRGILENEPTLFSVFSWYTSSWLQYQVESHQPSRWNCIKVVKPSKKFLRRSSGELVNDVWNMKYYPQKVLCSPNLSTTAELSDVRWIPTKKVVHIGRISTLFQKNPGWWTSNFLKHGHLVKIPLIIDYLKGESHAKILGSLICEEDSVCLQLGLFHLTTTRYMSPSEPIRISWIFIRGETSRSKSI